jgi:hypothetical protein
MLEIDYLFVFGTFLTMIGILSVNFWLTTFLPYFREHALEMKFGLFTLAFAAAEDTTAGKNQRTHINLSLTAVNQF